MLHLISRDNTVQVSYIKSYFIHS